MAKRRGNNEGSIGRLKDGRWQGRVSLPTGKRKAVYGKSHAECRKRLDALKRNVEEGRVVQDDLTVKQYLEKWLAHRALEVKPKTISGDRYQCHKYIIPKLSKKKLSKLNVLHIQDMMVELADEVSPYTANRSRKVLKTALGQAVRWRLIRENPVNATKKLKEDKRQMTIWTYEEAARFKAATMGHRLYPLFLLMMSTGLRISEVLGLRWKDVAGDRIHVRHTATLVDGKLHFDETTKTDSSNRIISIPPDVVQALTKHRAEQREKYQILGTPKHDLVFDSKVGTPLSPYNLERDYTALKQAAEVPHATFHDLRHWHASMLIEEGVDVRLIAKRLGHAGPHITLSTYTHLFDKQQQIEPISLDDILPKVEERAPVLLN